MAFNNAKFNFSEKLRQDIKNETILYDVKSKIELKRLPKIIEAFEK